MGAQEPHSKPVFSMHAIQVVRHLRRREVRVVTPSFSSPMQQNIKYFVLQNCSGLCHIDYEFIRFSFNGAGLMTVARMTWIEKKKAYELMTNFMVSRTSVGQFENSFFPTYSKPTLNTGLEASEQRVFSVTQYPGYKLYINFTFLISERHRRGEKAPVRKREVPGSHPDNYQEINL